MRRKLDVVVFSATSLFCAVNMLQSINVKEVLKYMQIGDLPKVVTRLIGDNGTMRSPQLEDNSLIHEYRKRRNETYDSWFKPGSERLLENADKNGSILDFVIAGFAKCGTTEMEAMLGNVAPMPIGDICKPSFTTVFYSYKLWPKKYGEEKVLRGSKCPQYIDGGYLKGYSKYLPRAKVIIGIRHPILWFQSFWNMQKMNGLIKEKDDPMTRAKPCGKRKSKCYKMCPGQLFCMHRGRFHISLAQLGKTALSEDERNLLAPNDRDGGKNLVSRNIRNPIFLYEQSELSKDHLWDELATYLNVASISHDRQYLSDKYSDKVKMYNRTNFCDGKYDNFRAMMMPYAYELSMWLEDYFIPVARNESSDVTIANVDMFADLVASYKKDPCNRLYRVNNGTYALDPNKANTIKVTYT